MGGGVPNTRERARQPASRRELLFDFCYCFVFLISFCELGKKNGLPVERAPLIDKMTTYGVKKIL